MKARSVRAARAELRPRGRETDSGRAVRGGQRPPPTSNGVPFSSRPGIEGAGRAGVQAASNPISCFEIPTRLLARLGELFPRLRLGTRAVDQIAALTGSEPVFRQLLRHLRALDASATRWPEGEGFEPGGVTYSVESKATLDDGTLGPMRDFPVPEGFEAERWSLHTKLTGGAGARLYFRAVRTGAEAVVLVGYFGDHLPTVRYRT